MKRLLLFVCALCLSALPCLRVLAYDYAIENADSVTIYYNNDSSHSGNTLYVTYAGSSYTNVKNSYSGDVVIPDSVEIDGTWWTIRGIVQYCFRACENLTSVVLPNTMTTFGASSSTYGFYGCTALTSVTLPNQVQAIPSYTFRGCTALTTVTYDGAEDDGECFHIPATVNAINDYAFYGCSALAGNLTLPSTLNYVAQYAFQNCTGLTSVTVAPGENILYAENSSSTANSTPFRGCSALETVYLNRSTQNVTAINSTTSHAYGLFRNMNNNLTTIYIGKECREIGPYTFHTSHNVTQVIFEEGSQLEVIGEYAFYSSVGYGSGNSTDVVEGSTFYVPDSVKEIGKYAFYQDYGLEGIVFGADSQLETIDGYAFGFCSHLTEFTVPYNVTSIGENVWNSCKSLKKIHVLNPEPTAVVKNDFSSDGDMDWPLVIYVPYGSEEAYEASDWGTAIVYSDTYLGKIIFNSSVVTIDSADSEGTYYATYYHPYALDIPDGVAAYAVTAYDGDSGALTLSAVTDVIPQHSGVLLSRTSDNEISSYRIYIAEDDTHDALSGNMLYGSEEAATTNVDNETEGYYFYGLTTKGGENLGFYWGAENGGAFEMPANKAWLALPATGSGAPRYLSLVAAGADTTGISAVDASSAADGAIYTLQGVRVSDLSHKGIYIVNGKKVLVK